MEAEQYTGKVRDIAEKAAAATGPENKAYNRAVTFTKFMLAMKNQRVAHYKRENCQVDPKHASWPTHSYGNTAIKAEVGLTSGPTWRRSHYSKQLKSTENKFESLTVLRQTKRDQVKAKSEEHRSFVKAAMKL